MKDLSQDRLFVPLNADAFSWFESGGKQWELRRYGRQYTEKHIKPGRIVELRRGYSDPRRALWGKISAVERASTLSEFFEVVPYELVIPTASDRDQAVRLVESILGLTGEGNEPLIGFQVDVER